MYQLAMRVINLLPLYSLETPLLAATQQRGNPTVNGLGMLLNQGQYKKFV